VVDLDAVFAEHHGALFRFLSRLSGDPELAKDAVQETFLRLAQRPPANGVRVDVWLYRVGATLARDAIRKRQRRQSLLRKSAHRVPHATAALDPSVQVERSEVRRTVQRALRDLSERERTILLMREDGFTHREIAEAVGTTTRSVGTLLARALKKLTRILAVQRESL
jgi:RNA polymerase sigma factor (sigma-70 family)